MINLSQIYEQFVLKSEKRMKKVISIICAIAILSGVLALLPNNTPVQYIFGISVHDSEDARETIFHEVNVNIYVMENHSFYVKVSVFAEVFVSEDCLFREGMRFFFEIHGENFVVTPITVVGGNLRHGQNRSENLRPYRTWLSLESSMYDISPKTQEYSILYHVQFINYDNSNNNYFDWVVLPRRWFSGGADVQSFNATINMPKPFNHEKVEVFRNRNHSDYYPANIKKDFIDNTILLSSNEPIPRRDDISIRISLPDGYFANVPTSQAIDTIRRLLFALILLPMFIAFVLAVLFRKKIITNPFAIENANLMLVTIGFIPLLSIFIIYQVFNQPWWFFAVGLISCIPVIIGAAIMIHSIKDNDNVVLIVGSVVYLGGIIWKLRFVLTDFSPMVLFMVLSASVSFMFAAYVKRITRKNLSENQSS